MSSTLYERLGVSRSASKSVIEAACLRLGELYRPDKNGSAEATARFAEIEKAYEILLNDRKREDYDEAIARAGVAKIKRSLLAALWILLCAAWIAALIGLVSQSGSIEAILLSARARMALMDIVPATLSLFAAIRLLTTGRIPPGLLVAAGALAAVHLVNATGIYLDYESNGRISATHPVLMAPFHIVFMVAPTLSLITMHPTGNWALFPLPVFALAVTLASVTVRATEMEAPASDHRAPLRDAPVLAGARERALGFPSPFCLFFCVGSFLGAYLLWPKYFAGGAGLPGWIAQLEAAVFGLAAAFIIGRAFETSNPTVWRTAAAGITTMLVTLLLVSYATFFSFILFQGADYPYRIPNFFLAPAFTFASWVAKGSTQILQKPAIGALVFAVLTGTFFLVRRPPAARAAWGTLLAFAPAIGLVAYDSYSMAEMFVALKASSRRDQMHLHAQDALVIAVALATAWWVGRMARKARQTA